MKFSARLILVSIFYLSPLLAACTSQSVIPPTPTPTSTSTPSSTPTSTQTPEPTITSTPVPNGPCDNPLLPLVTGYKWTYLVTGGREPYPYSLSVGERADIGNINIYVEMVDAKHQHDVKELVVCREGAIDNFPLHVMSMLLSDFTGGILNTYKQSGVYTPAYSVFAQNDWVHAWQARYLVEESVSMIAPAGGMALFLRLNDPIEVSFQTEGNYEPITVGAGSFPQALMVENDYTMAVTIQSGTIITGGDLAIHTRQWYVPYIGLIRAVVDSASVSIMPGQASGMEIPAVLELMEFSSGEQR